MPPYPSTDHRPELLGQTVPDAGFSPAGLRAFLAQTPATESPRTAGDAPRLPGIQVARRCPELAVGEQPADRYQVERLLGTGATGEVYSIRDRNLDRLVAVKVLSRGEGADADAAPGFVGEARITAALKHPGIPPVHDLDVSEDGRLYFSMTQVAGRSLGELIAASTLERRDPRLASYNAIVTVFIAIGNAIAFAHHQRILHQDLKPDNILLGEFGEVLVLDWGAAARFGDDGRVTARLYGTPLYMSPEQARREGAERASDIYCLGASLFHALLLRVPTWSPDADEFWRRKRAGSIDQPTVAERRAVPPPLLTIALKALAPAVADRYADVEGLVRDLEAYQAGLAVSAHRYSSLETVTLWCRRNRRTLAWSAALLIAVLASLGVFFGERLKEVATWGPAILAEDLRDDSWRTRWAAYVGTFARQDGRLVSTSQYAAVLMCRRRFVGATAIEFTGEVLPGTPLCDLSVYWCRDAAFDADGAHVTRLDDLYKIQVGAYDNSYSAIILPDERQVAIDPLQLAHGRRYRIRVEIVGNAIRLLVDGRQRCEYLDPFPFSSGYLGIYGYYRGKAFSDLRIHSLGVPERPRATEIGDAFAQKRLYDLATEQYTRVSATFPGTGLAHEALYKAGLCQFQAGHVDEAFAIWSPLAGTPFADLVALQRVERAFALGDHARVIAGLADLGDHASADLRDRAAVLWGSYVYQLGRLPAGSQRTAALEEYLRLHDLHFAGVRLADRALVECLSYLGRDQEVIERFPANRHYCVHALVQQGRLIEVVHGYADQRGAWMLACQDTGSYTDLIEHADDADLRAFGMVMRGRGREVLEQDGLDPNTRAMALLSLGRFRQVLELPGIDGRWTALAQIGLGQADRAATGPFMAHHLMALDEPRTILDLLTADGGERTWASHLAGLDAFIAGDHAGASAWFVLPSGQNAFDDTLSFARCFIVPFLAEQAGQAGALERSCASIIAEHRYSDRQRPWYAARFLTGAIDAREFLEQPLQLSARAWLLAVTGLKAERAGAPAAALAAYRDYLALPPQRHGVAIDPLMDRFVAWRAQVVAAPPRSR
jgi:hypothetical protein